MMPETLTLEQAQQLAQSSKQTDFNPFGADSFEGLVNDANKRKYEHTLKILNLEDKNVRNSKKQ